MATTPLCRFRVLYLGSEVPTRSKDGLQGVQEPLEQLYPEMGAPDLAGVDAYLSVWSNGVLIEPTVTYNIINPLSHPVNPKRFYHIDLLHYCAAVRYCEYGALGDAASRNIGLLRFLPLDTPQARDSAPHHPPLFSLIMRRSSGIKLLECKAFVCKSDEAANELVRACFRAYSDTAFAHVLENSSHYQQQQQPNLVPVQLVGNVYAGSALAAPTGYSSHNNNNNNSSRSLLATSMSSGSLEQLNGYNSSENNNVKKKKKRSPFWPFIKPAGERRRSRSLNTPRPPMPAEKQQQTQQQQQQPMFIASPEYGSVVYYYPNELVQQQQQPQRGTSLIRMPSSAVHPNNRHSQPLHVVYAPQPTYWPMTAAAPVASSGNNAQQIFSGGYVPTSFAGGLNRTSSRSTTGAEYVAYEQPPSLVMPYNNNHRHQQQQQPWTASTENYDLYYDPYQQSNLPTKNGHHHVVMPPNEILYNKQIVQLRKAKSLARHDNNNTNILSHTNNDARQHSPRRHRVRSGGNHPNESSIISPMTIVGSTAAAKKPPIMMTKPHSSHTDSMPASSKSASISSTTSSMSSHHPYRLAAGVDRSHAHTKTMMIHEDVNNNVVDDMPQSRVTAIHAHEQQKPAKTFNENLHISGNNNNTHATDQSSTSSAVSSEGSGGHEPTLANSTQPKKSSSNNRRQIDDSKYVTFNNEYAADAALKQRELAMLVDELRIDEEEEEEDERPSSAERWREQTIISKTKVDNSKHNNNTNYQIHQQHRSASRDGLVASVSPVDSGQHDEPVSVEEDQRIVGAGKFARTRPPGNKWQHKEQRHEHAIIGDNTDNEHASKAASVGYPYSTRRSQPYIPEVDYEV